MKSNRLQLMFCAIVALPVVMAPDLAMSASTNPSVTVVNTTTNPVPVSGTITLNNTVVPVEVRNADPIMVNDPSAAGRTPVRYGPILLPAPGIAAEIEVVPAVPAGKDFVVTSLHVLLLSADSTTIVQTPLCWLKLRPSSPFLGLALTPVVNEAVGNLALSLPLRSGESLKASCNMGTAGFVADVTVSGYFVAATN